MLTVVSFLFEGRWAARQGIYRPEHALNLRTMVRKHLRIPHRFVLIDDGRIAGDRKDLETYPCWELPHLPEADFRQNYLRLKLYHEASKVIGDRILMLDLDTVIRADITDLIHPDGIWTVEWQGKRLGGAMQLMSPGVCNALWDDVLHLSSRAKARHLLGSDQAVLTYARSIGLIAPGVWTAADGVGRVHGPQGPLARRAMRGVVTPPWRIACGAEVKPWDIGANTYEDYARECQTNTQT